VVTVLAVVAAVLPVGCPRPVWAAETPSGESAPRDPLLDRANVLQVWQYGGAFLRAAAAQALLGGDAEIATFATTGWQEPQRLDDRIAIARLTVQGGDNTRAASKGALDSSDANAVRTFLDSGWQEPYTADVRQRIKQLLAAGGPQVQQAAQAALDTEDVEQYEEFLESGWREPWTADQRQRVKQVLAAGGPYVQQAAQAALDTENAEAYAEFLGSGWALATARDQENATLADLMGSAKAASQEAVRQTEEAKQAGVRAAAATEAARVASVRAAELAESAKDNAQLAAAAARAAADAANQAAAAANEAANAAKAANAAARAASAAAARAAAAATRAANAATDAYNAASAAETGAGTAKDARDRAVAARNAAQDAKATAAVAAEVVKTAYAAAGEADTAANGAAAEAIKAADAADRAAGAAGEASAEARAARAAAARARANADRAKRAAASAAKFARAAAAAAQTAANAANQAAKDAEESANAAEAAAKAADEARMEAQEATNHANAATVAANNAVAAAKSAHEVYDAARQADNDRVAQAAERAEQAAASANDLFASVSTRAAADAEQATLRDAETNRLIAEATNPATARVTVIVNARKVALALADGEGSWTKQAALAGLGGSDDMAIDFVRNQLPWAAGMDNRVKLGALADPDLGTTTNGYKTAAQTALAGTDAQVAAFLRSGDYSDRAVDLRLAVKQVLAAALKDGNQRLATDSQAALDEDDVAAMQAFLTAGQDEARAIDERVKVKNILANAPDHTMTQALAQAALDGPRGLLHQFLTVGVHQAEQADAQSAAHVAAMASMLSQIDQATAVATQWADEAQNVAAKARDDSDAATRYAAEAARSAEQAATAAAQAKESAAAAQASAERAAASAAKAAESARQAEASAHTAARSAAWADQSARQAAASASAARADATRAYNAAVAAREDANTAIQAANDARSAAISKAQAEEKAARDKMREDCRVFLKEDVPNGKDSYNKCLDMAAMSSEQLQAIADKNAGTCKTLFPNEHSKEYGNCLKDATDPAFDTNQNLIAKQLRDQNKFGFWDWVAIGAVAVIVIVAGCALVVTCGAVLSAAAIATMTSLAASFPTIAAIAGVTLTVLTIVNELTAPFFAPGLVTVGAATGANELLLSGMSAAKIGEESTVEVAAITNGVRNAENASNITDRLITGFEKCLTNSFTPDTPVLLADGTTKAIAQIRVFDKVLATDPITGITAVEPVTMVHRNTDTDLADVGVSSPGQATATLHTTAHHPFWDATTRQWTDAGRLQNEHNLRTPTGDTAQVAAVGTFTGRQDMHNLTVANLHTYYVVAGHMPVLVHNTNPSCGLFPNTMPELLNRELALAERLGVTPSGPGSVGFDEAIGSGTIKWAVRQDGSLVVMPKFVSGREISHSVLTQGAPVRAAGEADIAGSSEAGYFGLDINIHSGHFLPSEESRQIGIDAFAAAWVHF
jgi:hypothetical protein